MSAEVAGPQRWLVLGGSGFVGAAIVKELQGRNLAVASLPAPRLSSTARDARTLRDEARNHAALTELQEACQGADVVINAAGLATPGDADSPALTGANALLPAVAALAAHAAGAGRFVQLSSASVQGHRSVIDESPVRAPFSAYSRSKALGEEVLELLGNDSDAAVVTIRATSVQGPHRPTTQSLVRVARSPLASVCSPGTAPTPVSSIDALAWFVVETGLHAGAVPKLVLQPWEGLDVSRVLEAAGGRTPLKLPRWFCRTALSAGYFISGLLGDRLHGALRRVELMWFGQAQAPGWAEAAGLRPEPLVRAVLEAARSHAA